MKTFISNLGWFICGIVLCTGLCGTQKQKYTEADLDRIRKNTGIGMYTGDSLRQINQTLLNIEETLDQRLLEISKAILKTK